MPRVSHGLCPGCWVSFIDGIDRPCASTTALIVPGLSASSVHVCVPRAPRSHALDGLDEDGKPEAQCSGKLLQVVDTEVALSALNAAHVGAMQVDGFAESFLTDVKMLAAQSNDASEKFSEQVVALDEASRHDRGPGNPRGLPTSEARTDRLRT